MNILVNPENLQTDLRLIVPPTDPRIAFDTQGLTNQFQSALVEAGKERLNQEIQKQLNDKLGDKLPAEIKDIIKTPDNIIKGIGDLLGGKKK